MDIFRNCLSCNKKFKVKPRFSKIHKFCSNTCARKNATKRYLGKKRIFRGIFPKIIASYNKICVICGNSFISSSEIAKYCSHRCRRINENKRSDKSKIRSNISKVPCEVCGFDNLLAIHRHHINPENGNAGGAICLCANCHYIYHGIVGWNGKSEHKTREEVISIVLSCKTQATPLETQKTAISEPSVNR